MPDDERGKEGLPITREVLESGSNLALMRRLSLSGITVRSDAEIDASLDETLAAHPPDKDAWLFGYGSLMWNPVIDFAEKRTGRLKGFHRRFCLRLYFGRATPEQPGLMLALDEGGTCDGVAFRVAADKVRAEMRLVWRREMATGAYRPVWVDVETDAGPVRAVTFAVNRDSPRYEGCLSDDDVADALATATGHLGSCRAYLQETAEALSAMGVRDEAVERLWMAVAAKS